MAYRTLGLGTDNYNTNVTFYTAKPFQLNQSKLPYVVTPTGFVNNQQPLATSWVAPTETYLTRDTSVCPPWLQYNLHTQQAVLKTARGNVDPRFVWQYMLDVLDHNEKLDKGCDMEVFKQVIRCWLVNPRTFIEAYRQQDCPEFFHNRGNNSQLRLVKDVELYDIDANTNNKPSSTKKKIFSFLFEQNLNPYVAVVTMGDMIQNSLCPCPDEKYGKMLQVQLSKLTK